MENILDSQFADHDEVKLIKASKGKRFTNYLIDYIFIMIFIVIMFFCLDAFGIVSFMEEDTILDRLIGMLFYAIGYCIMEGGLKGKTPGKFVTKTRTVTKTGELPDMNTFIKRSFSRIVPFEAFSFLGDDLVGWHDKWTDTIVIDERTSVLPKKDSIFL